MGSSTRTLAALAVGLAVLATAGSARADDCVGRTEEGERFAICFDPGRRLALLASSDGFGWELDFRHGVNISNTDIVWRFEHRFASWMRRTTGDEGVLYAGRYIRHAESGHMVIPIGRPRRIFVPFDIGVEVELGRFRRTRSDGRVEFGVVNTAALFELSRSPTFRRRVAIGARGGWDIDMADDMEDRRHHVSPLSVGLLDLYFESRNGLTVLSVRGEAGSIWSSGVGWRPHVAISSRVERALIAINDRPLSLFISGRIRNARAGRDRDALAEIGLRWAILSGVRQ